METKGTRQHTPELRIAFVKKDAHVAEVWARPEVRLIIDCREGFTDPEPWALLLAAAPALLAALEQIAKGEGAFSRDPLEHASNVIEEAKAIASAAIRKATVVTS